MSEDVPRLGCEFRRLLRHEPVCVQRVALECAADFRPQLDVEHYLRRLDSLAQKVQVSFALPPLCAAERREVLRAIGKVLYEQQGFQPAREDYHDPANSLLDQVLDRRRGIPLTLALVFQAVALRLGVDVYGVCTPGHFMLGCKLQGRCWYIDAFNYGELLTQEQCRRRVEQMSGPQQWQKGHFRRASPRQMIVRLLRNLKNAWVMQDSWANALCVQKRLMLLCPQEACEYRDMGLILLRNGQPHRALRYLLPYQQAHPDEAELLRPFVRAAQRLAAEQN